MKECIEVPIYFGVLDNGEIHIDIEGIQDVFNRKLQEVVDNPKEFLEV